MLEYSGSPDHAFFVDRMHRGEMKNYCWSRPFPWAAVGVVLLFTVGVQLTFWRDQGYGGDDRSAIAHGLPVQPMKPLIEERGRDIALNRNFPCMKTITLPAFARDDGTVLPLPLSDFDGSACERTDDDGILARMRLKYGRDKLLPLASNASLSGYPKTGTSLLHFVLWEILLQHYGMEYHISPAKIHRDIDCMIRNYCMFQEDLALLLLTIPYFNHSRDHTECAQERRVLTIRRIDEALRSRCVWHYHDSCDLKEEMKRAEKYANYYKVALSCGSYLPIPYSSLSRAVNAPEESDAFLTQMRTALDYLNWTQVSDASIIAALKKSDMKSMGRLEESLKGRGYRPKVDTSHKFKPKEEWTREQLQILDATVTRDLGSYLKDPRYRADIAPNEKNW